MSRTSSSAMSASDLESRARQGAASLQETAAEYASKAGDQIQSALETAEQTARNVAEQGREAGQNMQKVAGNMRTAIDKSMNDQPMATLGMAVIAGFVLGALWKS